MSNLCKLYMFTFALSCHVCLSAFGDLLSFLAISGSIRSWFLGIGMYLISNYEDSDVRSGI